MIVLKPSNTVERVAAAICKAAGETVQPVCPMCEEGHCTLWPQFVTEAQAAMAEMRRSRR